MNGLATKQQLFKVLKMTRAGMGIKEMELNGKYVIIHYEGGIKKGELSDGGRKD